MDAIFHVEFTNFEYVRLLSGMYAERKGDIEVIWRGRLAELAVPDFITRVNFALELISWKERSGRT